MLLGVFLIPIGALAADLPTSENLRYLRAGDPDEPLESEIKIQHGNDGLAITSVTHRGASRLTLVVRFDSTSRLATARVMVGTEPDSQTAIAEHADGKARVTRHDGRVNVLDCPPGVIVTSAPDWTDAVLLVRRYDLERCGEQEFAGLWIHPRQEPLPVTFKVTHTGEDNVQVDDQRVHLDRLLIVLRGGSRYIAWRDDVGRMVRLVPERSPHQGLVLDGWERVPLETPEK
jgi:hypothetical protein